VKLGGKVAAGEMVKKINQIYSPIHSSSCLLASTLSILASSFHYFSFFLYHLSAVLFVSLLPVLHFSSLQFVLSILPLLYLVADQTMRLRLRELKRIPGSKKSSSLTLISLAQSYSDHRHFNPYIILRKTSEGEYILMFGCLTILGRYHVATIAVLELYLKILSVCIYRRNQKFIGVEVSK